MLVSDHSFLYNIPGEYTRALSYLPPPVRRRTATLTPLGRRTPIAACLPVQVRTGGQGCTAKELQVYSLLPKNSLYGAICRRTESS